MSRQVFGSTHVGLVRTNNQDRVHFGTTGLSTTYAILCDGMGGESGGAVAADISVDFAKKILARDLSDEMSELSIRAIFSSIFSAANALILEASCKECDLKGMGTTMILAVIKDESLYVGSVGDSRVYVVDKKQQRQITTDHTIVQIMLDKGEISKEDAASHPKRHFITRAVGVSDTVNMDFIVEKLLPDDIVLLCSDGLYNYIEPNTLYKHLQDSLKDKSAQNLIDLANDGGGGDNISVIVMV